MGRMGGDKWVFLASVFEGGGSGGTTNRARRPQMRVAVSKSEFLFVRVFEGGGK